MAFVYARTRDYQEPLQGQQFGNYTLIREIGHGGYATVYQGKHIYLQTYVAIKMLNLFRTNHDDVKQFLAEARLLADLKHPNIIRVHDFGWERGTPFLVMDYAPGGTVGRTFSANVPLPLAQILPVIMQAANALQYVHHHRLIHGDVKPENLLLGPRNAVWLSDFGIAMTLATKVTELRGTVRFMAPEQIHGSPQAASDQYSLAVIVYKWLCGRWPFEGSALQVCYQHLYTQPPPLRGQVSSIPLSVERIVLKALSKEPEKRFAHVLEFALALQYACKASRAGYARLRYGVL